MEFESGLDLLCSQPSLHSCWFFDGDKAGGAWGWSNTGIWWWRWGWHELYPYLPSVPAWHLVVTLRLTWAIPLLTLSACVARTGQLYLIRRFLRKALITFRQVRHSVFLSPSVHLSFRPCTRLSAAPTGRI